MATSTHTRTLGPLEVLSRDVERTCARGRGGWMRAKPALHLGIDTRDFTAKMKGMTAAMDKLTRQFRIPYR